MQNQSKEAKYAYVKSSKNGCSRVNMLGKISKYGKKF